MTTHRVLGCGWTVTQSGKFVVLGHRTADHISSTTHSLTSDAARKIARALDELAAECDRRQAEAEVAVDILLAGGLL